ncbi:MAG: tetratricopeptide repeat protein [Planctomycetaceae bacterium]
MTLACGLLVTDPAAGQRPARQREPRADAAGLAARRLLERGQELLDAGEHDRGVKMLETVIEQYPEDSARFAAHLALGRHAVARSEQLDAIGHLRALAALEQPGREMTPDQRDVFVEGLYLQGVALFQTRQYAAAFPILRRITNDFPHTVWANQSFYYIGMCHFAQGNWNKAIEALGLVGTFVDPRGGGVERAEAGRRFYVKIRDTDLPVLERLGTAARVMVATAGGDRETVPIVALPGDEHAALGSLATVLGKPVPGDGVLQVVGGDTLRTTYLDATARDGRRDVERSRDVKLVSTAALTFTRGDFESPSAAAFPGQPVFLLLSDADLDVSDRADSATVRVYSRFREELGDDVEQDAAGGGVDLDRMLATDDDRWRTRDEVSLTLRELPAAGAADALVHSGLFGGRFPLAPVLPDQPVNRADDALAAAVGDEIVAVCTDALHIGGATPRTVTATVVVAAEIENKPRAVQYEVADPVVAARKNLVEAAAFLELGRIFRSMGLMKGAVEKVTEGLARVDPIVRQAGALPGPLTEEAFRAKWDLHIVADDFAAAIATCELFNRLYPESPFVDQALLQIGRIEEEQRRPDRAIEVYRRILALPASRIKAEAQYRIARATEQFAGPGADVAIAAYKTCAQRYPDSPFAGESLGKLVDYHIDKRDYTAAADLLEQIFQDHPDAQFLDSMLLKWVMVAYRLGDFRRASEKCSQLIFEYPSSPFAEKARALLPKIEARTGGGAAAAPAQD